MQGDGGDGLITERRSGHGSYADRATAELVTLMNAGDATVPAVVGAAAAEIAAVVDAVAERLGRGGRLVYAGAGTSGALAALDAAECEATFSCDRVLTLVAGASAPSAREREAAEDDADAGAADVRGAGVSPDDAVVGVTASGRTPYVLGALAAARDAGAFTAAVVAAPDSPAERAADRAIVTVVGAEFVAGSTRLKAGTAQKLVLNTISTIAMIRIGKTYGDLMVDVVPANEKLRARARRAVLEATGAAPEAVDEAFVAADGDARVAILSLVAGIDAAAARSRLASAGGNLEAALRA